MTHAVPVLVVDDDPITRTVLESMLEEAGAQVAGAAANCQEAVDLLSSGLVPKLCFLDVNLPDGNGFDLTDRLRQILPDVRIVIVSGSATIDVLKQVAAKKCQGFLLKPFGVAKLSELLKQAGV